MNDRVDLRFVEQSANRIAIAQIRFTQRKFLAGNFANAVQRVGFGIDEIIQNDHLVPRIQQLHARSGFPIKPAPPVTNTFISLTPSLFFYFYCSAGGRGFQ